MYYIAQDQFIATVDATTTRKYEFYACMYTCISINAETSNPAGFEQIDPTTRTLNYLLEVIKAIIIIFNSLTVKQTLDNVLH